MGLLLYSQLRYMCIIIIHNATNNNAVLANLYYMYTCTCTCSTGVHVHVRMFYHSIYSVVYMYNAHVHVCSTTVYTV